MSPVDFLSPLHRRTSRDYLARVTEFPKAEAARVAKQFGREYWDGDRRFGYGGYHYDGRWFPMASSMAEHYRLEPGMRVLDVGCGKGFLLYELTRAVPGLLVAGLDVSEYAVENAREEVRPFLTVGRAEALPYPDASFDLVVTLTTLQENRLTPLPGDVDLESAALYGCALTTGFGVIHRDARVAIGESVVVFDSIPLHFGQVLTGSHGGGSVPSEDIPRSLRLQRAGRFDPAGFISHRFPLEEINRALEAMRRGEVVRALLDMSGGLP